MDKKLVIGYLTSIDPMDKRTWSGTYYTMLRTLEKESFSVIPLGPVQHSDIIFKLRSQLYKIWCYLQKGNDKTQSEYKSRRLGKKFKKILKRHKVDIIFAPASSSEIANLDTSIPICYLSDTSFNQIYDNYRDIYKYSDTTIKVLGNIEQKAISKSSALIYPTEWAANFVIEHYKADSKKVHIVKFGPNLDSLPARNEIIKDFSSTIHLLMLGVNWKLKGGDIAFKAFELLLERGYDVTFTVCGCVPPVTHEKMTVIPFLNKNKAEDLVQFKQLLFDHHILLLPTRIDCFGIVFCEAAAFGMPVVTSDTCGVSCVVQNGITGFTLPLNAVYTSYADRIQLMLDHPEEMQKMAQNAREEYEKELNWEVWGRKMKRILSEMIKNQ